MMNFGVTPLISGIFTPDRVALVHNATAQLGIMVQPPQDGLIPTSTFAYAAYNYKWLGGTLPPFMTDNFTVLPITNTTVLHDRNETWTYETTLYESALNCSNATVAFNLNQATGGFMLNISSVGGTVHRVCQGKADIPSDRNCDRYMPFDTPWSSIAANITRSAGQPYYLFAWATQRHQGWSRTRQSMRQIPVNISAIACQATYYSENVIATVKMPTGEIQFVRRRRANRTAFTALQLDRMVLGLSRSVATLETTHDDNGAPAAFGYTPTQLPNIDSQLLRWFGEDQDAMQTELVNKTADWSSHSIVYMDNVFALPGQSLAGLRPRDLQGLLNPGALTLGTQTLVCIHHRNGNGGY